MPATTRNSSAPTCPPRKRHSQQPGTLCVSGSGYLGKRAIFEGHPYFNTSVNGTGDRYDAPNSAFLVSRDNYLLLRFRRQPIEMIVELKALDDSVLDRTRYQ